MISRKNTLLLRRAHRYLGIFLGVQFVGWTLGGLYFSWTDIDQIHGDHFRKDPAEQAAFPHLEGIRLPEGEGIRSLELRDIGGQPYYWVNGNVLVDAGSGQPVDGISEAQARDVVKAHMRSDLAITGVDYLEAAGPHHEYREKPLPAYIFHFDSPEAIKAYVSARDGKFQAVRHRSWRWFDFLWMMHTMDYQGRDNFNTALLRVFSLLGLVTVGSGFVLWYVSSPRWRKVENYFKKT
ncbi:PepSY domain-containing protein [Robiginitalea marina]|uniref:PepSY domain-containing protein n=1 Tax=Robiginitalea marina TaxID=2954105 RepID=A0ABT1B1U4_9FLAO|nr:PepSY domain-containing protein [Robiginitalea marina]MCO5725383.1 PepSY domain-containing protein [Robiginitalea marina]